MPPGHRTDLPAARAASKPSTGSNIWQDGTLEIPLRRLWSGQKHTVPQIAAILSEISGQIIPPAAISGKAHRLKLGPKPENVAKGVRPRGGRRAGSRGVPQRPHVKADARPPVMKSDPAPLAVLPYIPAGDSITFQQLSGSTCKFPVNDGVPEWLFCGHAVAKGSYCAGHARVSYVPVPRVRREMAAAMAETA